MIADKIIWDDIKRIKQDYLLEYHPARASFPLANVSITLPSKRSPEEVANLLEHEFEEWARLYPVPTMASAFDEAGDLMDLSAVKPDTHITGYYDPADKHLTLHWGLIDDNKIPDRLKNEEHLETVYLGLPFRTREQIEQNWAEFVKSRRFFKRLLLSGFFLWLIVIPVTIELLGRSNPLIANLVLVFSFGKAGIEFLKVAGLLKKSRREEEKSAIKLKKDHYFWHCEKNPVAFARLKAENFEQEAKEQIRKEFEGILPTNMDTK